MNCASVREENLPVQTHKPYNNFLTAPACNLHVVHCEIFESKEEGKDQESIRSSTTHDRGFCMEKCQNHMQTKHTREPRGKACPIR